MLLHAKNECLRIGRADMDYIVFGTGPTPLVMIPGVGDGLKTVRGMAVPFAWLYRKFAKDFTVYVFSRIRQLPDGYSTRDMAGDLATAMEALGISNASVVGVSQGGMIAQHLAIEYPALVGRLVLAVTLARPNDTMRRVAGHWIELAKANDYRGILIDSAEKAYSEKRRKAYRPLYPFLGLTGRPKDLRRFIIQANACMAHDAYDKLARILCPTLVIGGGDDRVVGTNAAPEMAERIDASRLMVYEGLGHGAYEEAKDFNDQVLRFLLE